MKRVVMTVVAVLMGTAAAQALEPCAPSFLERWPIVNRHEVPTHGLKKDSVPLYPFEQGKSVQIDVMMGGQSLLMKLDTGATMSLIPDVVAAYIVRNGNGAWQEPVRFRLADGTIWEAKVVLINEVRIGRHVARNVRVGVSSSEGSLLSFSLLDDIAPFTINTRNKELVFHTEANL